MALLFKHSLIGRACWFYRTPGFTQTGTTQLPFLCLPVAPRGRVAVGYSAHAGLCGIWERQWGLWGQNFISSIISLCGLTTKVMDHFISFHYVVRKWGLSIIWVPEIAKGVFFLKDANLNAILNLMLSIKNWVWRFLKRKDRFELNKIFPREHSRNIYQMPLGACRW